MRRAALSGIEYGGSTRSNHVVTDMSAVAPSKISHRELLSILLPCCPFGNGLDTDFLLTGSPSQEPCCLQSYARGYAPRYALKECIGSRQWRARVWPIVHG